MLTITQEAVLQFRRAAAGEEGETALRVAARRVEDGSIDYGLGFDRAREGDLRVPVEGVLVVVAPASRALLDNAVVDFVEVAPGDYRFVFTTAAGNGEGEGP